MRLVATLGLMVSVALSGGAVAQGRETHSDGLQFTIGAGLISSPTFLGDDDYQIRAVPNISLRYGDRLTASLRGIEYVAFSQGGWRAGPKLSYDFGRKESADDDPFVISGDSSTDLVGLGDVDGTFELGGFVEYISRSVAARFELRQGIDGGHNGLVGEASINYVGQFAAIGRPAFFSVGPTISFGDDAYNSAYFDVSASQSTASGLSQFDADGGVNSVGLAASVMMPFTEKTSLVGFLGYDQLTGDIGKSSIVSERGSEDQFSAGVFINRSF